MSVFLRDADCTLYHGDVLDVLQGMPDESVDCVVTSPPYWGLRDYGNDGQIGLEPTPDAYVARMVAVFREVRRVLAPHGTCWVNLGDSYAAQRGEVKTSAARQDAGSGMDGAFRFSDRTNTTQTAPASKPPPGLKHKDMVGIPWRVAFALQADGWWLRSDIVWAKPNPMPESVTDRPTKSHEYVFLLTKQPRYWFDQEAVREPAEWARWGDQTVGPGTNPDSWIKPKRKSDLLGENGRNVQATNSEADRRDQVGGSFNNNPNLRANVGRNVRSVWTIATQPYPEAHFATYPEELVRRCVLAGCPVRVCRVCGKASERVLEVGETAYQRHRDVTGETWRDLNDRHREQGKALRGTGKNTPGTLNPAVRRDLGWSDCGHNDWRPGVVLDPFVGSGTTAKVARDHGRHSIGIDLNTEYLELAARRLQQLSLLTSLPAPVPATPLEGAERSATP